MKAEDLDDESKDTIIKCPRCELHELARAYYVSLHKIRHIRAKLKKERKYENTKRRSNGIADEKNWSGRR